MNDENCQTLSHAVGRRLRAIREEAGLTADDVARDAREMGLGWYRSTVAAIENGTRDLRLAEALLLPLVLMTSSAGNLDRPLSLTDFLPEGPEGEWVQLGPSAAIAATALRTLLTDPVNLRPYAQLDTPATRRIHERWSRPEFASRLNEALRLKVRQVSAVWPDASIGQVADVEQQSTGDVERKAASKYGLSVNVVTIAARAQWGRTMTAERDARLTDRAEPDASPRTVQALRGHVTRQLLSELAPKLEAVAKAKEDN